MNPNNKFSNEQQELDNENDEDAEQPSGDDDGEASDTAF
jgi:hypothetical protein